jgi:peptidyl-prolyl cis-trans isomerase B (cyclophilin B)
MMKKFYVQAIVLFFMAFLLCFTGYAQVKKTTATKATTSKIKTTKKPLPAKPIAKVKTQKPTSNPLAGIYRVKLITDSGTMVIRLYDSTPLHRDNFVKLVKQGFYDSLLFHRVIPQFMIQGGDPQSKNAEPGTMLGNGGDDMARIPAEFRPSLYHKKGVLAAARDGNPEKASSACQFYIVEGKQFTDEQLNQLEQGRGFKYTPDQRTMYKTIGGTPHLDMGYTVFGEVESGMDVISKISHATKDGNNRPVTDIRMHIELIK